jgi:S-adenosylmethionine/arginine decarboxylase-like enzyme
MTFQADEIFQSGEDLSQDPAALVAAGRAWGMELLLDLSGCDPETISSEDRIAAYAIELCEVIEMSRYGDPQVPFFGLADPKTQGHSLVQLIETSLVSAHFARSWDDFAAINVHSCMAFDVDKVVAFSRTFFGARSATFQAVARGVRS